MSRTFKGLGRPLTTVFVVFAMINLSSCSFIVTGTAERAANGYTKTFNLKINRVDPFMACIEKSGGVCPADELGDAGVSSFFTAADSTVTPSAFSTTSTAPVIDSGDIKTMTPAKVGAMRANLVAADLAREVLNHDVQSQLNALYSVVKGSKPQAVDADDLSDKKLFDATTDDGGNTYAEMNISLNTFQDYQEDIEAATLMGGWEALANEADLFADDAPKPEEERRRAYIKHYFSAYFREGKFFKATVDGSELKDRIVDRLKARIPGLDEANYQALAKELFPQFAFDPKQTEYVFGRIEDSGLVTRGGQKLAFPAVEASFTLGSSEYTRTDVDFVAVGSDLIRVLLHAVYDSDMQLPAVSNATGITAPLEPLSENDPTITNVDPAEFEKVQTRATQVEAVVSAGIGRVIRGISFLSLNNEALATAIETAIGLAVRKQIEKVVWCWYACKFDEIDDDVGDFVATSHGKDIRLTVNVDGLPDNQLRIEGKAVRE